MSQPDLTSGRSSVVVLEHATESFSALDLSRNGTDIIARINELVAEALMVSLAMIMLNEVGNS
ncbi:MAG: hypothetical protein ABGZ53_18180, partial [Fuerstiella sp.]